MKGSFMVENWKLYLVKPLGTLYLLHFHLFMFLVSGTFAHTIQFIVRMYNIGAEPQRTKHNKILLDTTYIGLFKTYFD